MAKGDNINNPNLGLTPVPGADGGTVNRYVRVNSEPDDSVTLDLPAAAYRPGTDTEFEDRFTEQPSPNGESLWNESDLAGVDDNRIWTVVEGGDTPTVVPGRAFVNRLNGADSYVVTEKPWTHAGEEFWWGQSPGERMADRAHEALDPLIPEDTRTYLGREAIEANDYEWDGYADLNDDEGLEFDELIEDDAKILTAINGLGELSPEQRQDFGGLLAAQLWKDAH